MSLTYQLSIEAKDTVVSSDSDLELDWNQYFDIESQTIINSKNKYHIYHHIQCEITTNNLLKRKKSNLKVDILESIKESSGPFTREKNKDIEKNKYKDKYIAIDIASGKKHKNSQSYLQNIQKIAVISLIYISHIILFTIIFKEILL